MAIKPVVRSRSFLIFSTQAAAETAGMEAFYAVRGQLTDETTLELARGAPGAALAVSWFVVELGEGRALHGVGSIGSKELTVSQPLGGAVDPNLSLPLYSSLVTDTSDPSRQDVISLTMEIAGPSTMEIDRGDVGSDVLYAWSVVELPP